MNHLTLGRLCNAIAAVCPVVGVSVPEAGNPASVRIDYDPAATAQERAAAVAAVAAFDWNPALDDTYAAQLAKAEAVNSIDYGGLKRGTPAERLVRALAMLVLERFNYHAQKEADLLDAIAVSTSLANLKTLAGAIQSPPQLTQQQLVDAIKAKIAETEE